MNLFRVAELICGSIDDWGGGRSTPKEKANEGLRNGEHSTRTERSDKEMPEMTGKQWQSSAVPRPAPIGYHRFPSNLTNLFYLLSCHPRHCSGQPFANHEDV